MTDINKQVAALLAFGFSRRDIAKIMSTSVHVVSLVARGERGVHGFDVYQLSQIDQLHRLVTQVLPREGWVGDMPVAAWFETPIFPGCHYTPMDLYVDGKYALVLEHAVRMRSPEAILREYDTNWIAFLDSRWEVFHPADGPPSVRLKVGAEP
jgi:hypothetical protein